ncbi:MAG: hypothetical protein AAF385_15255 [Pseudomonadota bacterium]
MQLQSSCLDYLHKTLILSPIHGHGWYTNIKGEIAPLDYQFVDETGVCVVKITEFLKSKKKIIGFIAKVVSKHQPFAKQWLMAFVMVGPEETNFTDRICDRYDIEFFGPNLDRTSLQTSWSIAGHAVFGENTEYIENRHESWAAINAELAGMNSTYS